jgi:hypothetical protein
MVEVNQNIRALIIKVRKPRVSILTGRVRRITSGRIRAFISPNTITVRKSDQLLAK